MVSNSTVAPVVLIYMIIMVLTFPAPNTSIISMCTAVILTNAIMCAINKSGLSSCTGQVIKEDGTSPLAKVGINESGDSCTCRRKIEF